jgi:hypothetical protein
MQRLRIVLYRAGPISQSPYYRRVLPVSSPAMGVGTAAALALMIEAK